MSTKEKINHKSGQVLLVTIMLVATVMTIVLSATFKSNTETQVSKLEEESQKALAAAESGIEAALKKDNTSTSIPLDSLSNLSNYSGQAQVVTSGTKTTFVSPLIPPDNQYTLYLYNYAQPAAPTFGGSIVVAYGNNGADCNSITLDIALIYGNGSNYFVKRYIADSGNRFNARGTAGEISSIGSPGTIEDTSFNCQTQAIPVDGTTPNPKVLIIHTTTGTKIGFRASSTLPAQGKTVSAEATSKTTGVSKKVELFQSYPQIPAEFFVTSF